MIRELFVGFDYPPLYLWYPIEYHLLMMTIHETNKHLTDTHCARAAATQLHAARAQSGLSLRELAARAGTSHATLLAYEQGKKSPSITTFLRILEAAGFGVDIRLHRRIREKDGISRGEELAAVLKLAEQFPARISKKMDFPVWPTKRL
jgi:transcriptional regulator with XRE-family HTH domain